MRVRGIRGFRRSALAVVVCLVSASVPMPASGAGLAQAGSVAGHVTAGPQQNRKLRLRNVDLGQVAGVATTDGSGTYAFAGVAAGNYIVELIGETGSIVGTSSPVIVSLGHPAVKGVVVTTTSALASAALAPGAAGGLFGSTAGLTVMAAAIAGITGIYMTQRNTKNASPSH